MTTNHHEDIFSSVTSRGAALWRSFSSSKMKQVQYETSMKNIPLGGNKEYVLNGIKPELVILFESKRNKLTKLCCVAALGLASARASASMGGCVSPAGTGSPATAPTPPSPGPHAPGVS